MPEGATLEIFELDSIPGFNQDDEQSPPAKVVELKARVSAADSCSRFDLQPVVGLLNQNRSETRFFTLR